MGLFLLAMVFVSPVAVSQTHLSPSPAPAARLVTLSNSVVALDGTWKFKPGDSPWVNGAPLWAQPGYDASGWATQNLTPKSGAVDLIFGTSGFVPGWTKQGHPNLSGYAWYRLRVRIANPGQKLWLKMPSDFDDAYQLYANGRFVGQFGEFASNRVKLYSSEPRSFPLPQPGPDGVMVLALRFYLSPTTQFSGPDAGGMHGPPALGLASTVQLMQSAAANANREDDFDTLLALCLLLLALPLAVWAWLYNREERAWLWLVLALAWQILLLFVVLVTSLTTALGLVTGVVVTNILIFPFWILFWWDWFGLREKRWIPRAAWLLAALMTLAGFVAQSPNLGLRILPLSALHWFNDAKIVWLLIPYGLLFLVVLVEGYRRDRTEALLATFPILLGVFSYFAVYLLVALHIPNQVFFFGLGIGAGTMSLMLMVLVIGALALRRFIKTQVRASLARQAVKKDLEQAQQLQQRVLVPEAIESKHFTVEAEYLPAQTVGGDFFQTMTRPDGTLLVVIGDVSGKGVSAAMLVAVLVGAIRSTAEQSFDPAEMLAMLNRRLIGRSGGHFATCLAAEIKPDGTMRIANAGHIPPYLNGEELAAEGSLPLGITIDVEYSVQTVILRAGDRLTFMTDGVVEATNEAKEMFGFERTREVSREDAAAIARQAQSFGQEDDITVIGVAYAAG